MFSFVRNCQTFFNLSVPFCISNSKWELLLLYILVSIWWCYCYRFWLSNRCVAVSYCYFNFQFPNDLWSCGALCIYLTFVYIFFGRCPGFLHIFNWAIVFLIVEFWVIYIFLLVRLGQKGPKMEVRGNGDQKIHVEGEQRKEKACPKGKP